MTQDNTKYYVRSAHNKQYVSASHIANRASPSQSWEINYVYWHKKYSRVEEDSVFTNMNDARAFADKVFLYLKDDLDRRIDRLNSLTSSPNNSYRNSLEQRIKKEQKIIKNPLEVVEVTISIVEKVV